MGDQSDLIQRQSCLNTDGERARIELQPEISLIPSRNFIESCPEISDHPSEDIDPPSGTLGVRLSGNVLRKPQTFDNRNQIRTIGFEHSTIRQRNFRSHLEFSQALAHRLLPGKKARLNPVRFFPETEVNTPRLELPISQRAAIRRKNEIPLHRLPEQNVRKHPSREAGFIDGALGHAEDGAGRTPDHLLLCGAFGSRHAHQPTPSRPCGKRAWRRLARIFAFAARISRRRRGRPGARGRRWSRAARSCTPAPLPRGSRGDRRPTRGIRDPRGRARARS